MGVTELGNALGINKSTASRLIAKGMPTSSVAAATAWRDLNVGKRRGKPAKEAPASRSSIPDSSPVSQEPLTVAVVDAGDDDSMAVSLRRAKSAERQAFKRLDETKKDPSATSEDIRKIAATYYSARANRSKAESDLKDHLRAEGVTMFLAEAIEIGGRGHRAATNMLQQGAKSLAVRLHDRSLSEIEKHLEDFFGKVLKSLSESF